MALKSRLQSMVGRLEETEDFTFDQLHENYKKLKTFAAKQQKEMASYMETSRAMCYASISSAEHYCAFFESSAGGATTISSPPPLRKRIAKGPNGYGMAIEDDGTVSGFTGQAGPAELAGVAIGMKVVAVNGVPTRGKAHTIAELQRCQSIDKSEVEFTFEAPATEGLYAVSSTFGTTMRDIKARNDQYSRDTRGELEKTLITDVLKPLEAYNALFGAFQDLINERQRARELYDRYRAKVRDLMQGGSARDPARLPRNEEKMKTAYAEYTRCNGHAITQLARFHKESVTFFSGLQRAYLAHQAAMFAAGHSTFESLLSLMTGSLNEAGIPLTPILPKVDVSASKLEPEPECLSTVPATLPAARQQPVSPVGLTPTNPFDGGGGASSNQPPGQPYMAVQAQTIEALPVQAYSATAPEAAPPAYSSTPGIPLVAAGTVPGTGGPVAQPPPPPYEAPGPTVQPLPFQHPAQQQSPSWAPNGGVGSGAPPPSYNSDPFAPAYAPAAIPASSNGTFSSGHGMHPTAISAVSPFADTPFDGTGGANVDASAGNPFAVSATTSSNGFVFGEPTSGTPAPAAIAGVDFPANLPPHLGGLGSSQAVNPDVRTAQGATRTNIGGWQTFE
jgi:hypothetical protein